MKERLKDFWGLDSPFLSFMKKIGWVFLLNIMFAITSIPVVTVGASAVAMYTILNKMIAEREFNFLKDYFRAFSENFLKSMLIWLIILVVTIILSINTWYVFGQMSGGFAYVMRIGTVIIAIAFCMLANMVFPLIARFDVNMKETLAIAVQIAISHPLLCLESVGFTVAVLGGSLAILYVGWFGGFFILFPMIAFGLHAFMQSYLFQKIFDEYAEEEESDPDYVTGEEKN